MFLKPLIGSLTRPRTVVQEETALPGFQGSCVCESQTVAGFRERISSWPSVRRLSSSSNKTAVSPAMIVGPAAPSTTICEPRGGLAPEGAAGREAVRARSLPGRSSCRAGLTAGFTGGVRLPRPSAPRLAGFGRAVAEPVRQCRGEGVPYCRGVGDGPVHPAFDFDLVFVPFEPVDHLQLRELGCC
jgi:hypothetical protein